MRWDAGRSHWKRDKAELMFVRNSAANINHGEHHKNVRLQNASERVQGDKNNRDDEFGQVLEGDGDLLTGEHVRVKTKGE